MMSRRTVLILSALAFLGSQPAAHAQATFGKPVAAQGPDEFGLVPPTREQLFRVQSEPALKERLRQELPQVKKVDFPKDAAPWTEVPAPAPLLEYTVAPMAGLVCYRPLYFEDKRTERFGQYVPCVQPLLSAGRFYGDLVLLPVRLVLSPPWTFDCDNR